MPGGRVELIAYFSSYSTELGRYSGSIPDGTTEVSLTIRNVTFEDSGQYFPAVHEGQKISTGLVTLLTVLGKSGNWKSVAQGVCLGYEIEGLY